MISVGVLKHASRLASIGAVVLALGFANCAAAEVKVTDFGKTADGTVVKAYTITNKNGAVVKLLSRGATLAEWHVPDKSGKMDDVVFGFDDVAGYESKANGYFGATAGRVANRIAGGEFKIDGHEYSLAKNDGPNTLHGGVKRSLDKVVWTGQPFEKKDGQGVSFKYVSPDGEEGFPGKLTMRVTYTFTDKNELRIDYEATADTPVDETLIPTGEIAPVAGTPLDFREFHKIGERVNELNDKPGKGYDHNFVLNNQSGKLALAAKVREPKSGRVLSVFTTEPGVQFYGGNFLDGAQGKGGKTYNHRSGLCLETQHYPDSIHHPKFPSAILRPGKTYKQTCVYQIAVE
jgi:aldose 1-epimerase